MPSLTIIEASTSGHTSFVIDEVLHVLQGRIPTLNVQRLRAESTSLEKLQDADALLFGSGTWNTGGVEGQLNPYMDELLFSRLKDAQIKKPMAFVSLGDDRYYFTTRCTEHFLRFQRQVGGTSLLMPLVIVNEPYDQTEKICAWGEKLAEAIRTKIPQ